MARSSNSLTRRMVLGQSLWLSSLLMLATSGAPSKVLALYEPLFNTVDDIPAEYFSTNQRLYGFVERIIDGDTIRVRHLPNHSPDTSSSRIEPLSSRKLSDVTLKIRLYGVDTPEIAKGKDQISQPFALEAKEYSQKLVDHEVVELILLKKDQYSRAICKVITPKGGDLSRLLLRKGLAELYTGRGAEYAGDKHGLEQIEGQAKSEKVGVWSLEDRLVSVKEAKACVRSGRDTNQCYRDGFDTKS